MISLMIHLSENLDTVSLLLNISILELYPMSKFKSKAEKKMLADATRGEWYNTVHYIAGNKGVGRLM